MPELPEVESVRRGLERAKLAAPIASVWRSDKPLRIGVAWRQEQLDLLGHRAPASVKRRGKYLVWTFQQPGDRDDEVGLLVHLGMTGRLLVHRGGDPLADHTHLVLRFDDDREVRFVDPRRFGGLRADRLPALHQSPPLSELGPEPLEGGLTGDRLRTVAGDSQRCIRDVLLDQRVVAGVGNIYALEALFEAGVHPLATARRLRPTAWDRIAKQLTRVLQQGIKNGGTTVKDFATVNGSAGRNQTTLWVYGRAGEPCRTCNTPILAFTHGNRGGALCPTCQPKGRGGWVR